jgi:hypothetical protein
MIANQVLKQELQTKLEQLPETKLQEVFDFVNFLLFQQTHSKTDQQVETVVLKSEHDPLLEFIGAVSHGALAQNIDEEVYAV